MRTQHDRQTGIPAGTEHDVYIEFTNRSGALNAGPCESCGCSCTTAHTGQAFDLGCVQSVAGRGHNSFFQSAFRAEEVDLDIGIGNLTQGLGYSESRINMSTGATRSDGDSQSRSRFVCHTGTVRERD